jgi:hypothetical protein
MPSLLRDARAVLRRGLSGTRHGAKARHMRNYLCTIRMAADRVIGAWIRRQCGGDRQRRPKLTSAADGKCEEQEGNETWFAAFCTSEPVDIVVMWCVLRFTANIFVGWAYVWDMFTLVFHS